MRAKSPILPSCDITLQLWKFFTIISSILIQSYSLFPLLWVSWWYKCWILCFCPTGLWKYEHFLFSLDFLCCPELVILLVSPKITWFYPLDIFILCSEILDLIIFSVLASFLDTHFGGGKEDCISLLLPNGSRSTGTPLGFYWHLEEGYCLLLLGQVRVLVLHVVSTDTDVRWTTYLWVMAKVPVLY